MIKNLIILPKTNVWINIHSIMPKNKNYIIIIIILSIIIIAFGGIIFSQSMKKNSQVSNTVSYRSSSISSSQNSIVNSSSSAITSSSAPTKVAVSYDKSYQISFLPNFEVKYASGWVLNDSKMSKNVNDTSSNSVAALTKGSATIEVSIPQGVGGGGVGGCVEKSDYGVSRIGKLTRVNRLNDQPGSEYNNYPIPTYIYLDSKTIVLPTDSNFLSTKSQIENAINGKGSNMSAVPSNLKDPAFCFTSAYLPTYFNTQSTKDQYGNEQKPLSIKLLDTDKLTSAQITEAEDLINQIKF